MQSIKIHDIIFISDFDEIVYTRTSPTDKYTNGLSITDANDDSDGDKLTNKEELSYGTNPLLSDSDFDDISDYDEVKKYMTDPNDDDSDKDNIIDGDEVKLGLKPNTDKSNGSTLDNQCTFKQNIDISNEILSYINVDDSPYELSIDIVSAGVAEKELSVSVGEFTDYSDNEKIIGKSVALSYNDKLSIDSAKVYFTPRKIEGKISDYMIFEFFPDNNYLLPVETKYTDSSAYVETAELGTFCLVNTKNIMQINSRASDSIVWDYTLGETEVLFFIDISACAEESFEQTKQSIHDFSEALFEHSDNAAVEIIGYKQPTDNLSKFIVKYNDSNNSEVLTNISSVDEVLKKLQIDSQSSVSDLDTALYMLDRNIIKNNIFSSTCENKYVFVTSDSTYALSKKFGYYYDIGKGTRDTLQAIYDSNVKLNVLFSDECMQEKNAISNFSEACAEYEFGVYSKSKTGYFANDTYAKIYSDAVIDLKTVPVMYTCSISPNTIPEKVERNAFINSLPKSIDSSKVPTADADGNIDFKNAAAKVGAKFESLYSACDKSDLTRNGYEQFMENQKKSVSLIAGSVQITPFSDKLLYADSDGDEIPDNWDASPNEKIDNNFKVIENIDNYGIDDIYHNNYLENIEKAENTYNSIESKWSDGAVDELINYFMGYGGCTPFSLPMQSLLDMLEGKFDPGIGSTPNGGYALLHYLRNSGKDVVIDPIIPLGTVKIQRKMFYEQMNSLFSMAEKTLIPGKDYSFITTQDTNNLWITDYHNVSTNLDQPGKDWWLTFGGARNGMKASISCTTDTTGKKYYSANITYYIYDFYDWDEKQEKGLADLHKYGKAKCYRLYGYTSFNVHWMEGSRYPNLNDKEYNNLSATSFDGIDDNNFLFNCFSDSMLYYSGPMM